MANFDPPDSHWADDFDARLMASFHHLKDESESLKQRVADLEARDAHRDEVLAQAIADMKHYSKGNK